MAYPGSYEEELNKILKLNNLPGIRVPSDSPSDRIIIKAQAAEEAEERRRQE